MNQFDLVSYVPLEIYIVYWVIVLILWTFLWSFLSMFIYRMKNHKKWIITWRSECTKCWHKLWFFDLIPIFSYLFLKWKCRYCKERIWFQYLRNELIFWFLFLLIYIVICVTTNLILDLSIKLKVHWLRWNEIQVQNVKEQIKKDHSNYQDLLIHEIKKWEEVEPEESFELKKN